MNIKSIFLGAATVALLAACGSNAFANTVTFASDNPLYRTGLGGEFTLTPGGGDPDNLLGFYASTTKVGTGFETFCLEYQEHISLPGTYTYAISSAAIHGGQAVSDPLSKGTTWLYSQFAQGTLAGYTYTPGASRAASAAALQATFWWLENELYSGGTSPDPGNTFSLAVTAFFGNSAAAKADASSGLYGVWALNLGPSAELYPNQDQLVYRGGGFSPLPDGGMTALLLGIGFGGVALLRRKLA